MTAAREWPGEKSSSATSFESLEPVLALLRLADTVRIGLDESLDNVGLSWARYEILDALGKHGTLTYGDLGRHLMRHRTSIGATVCAMEKSGLVVREPNPMKPQQFVVGITQRGATLLARAHRVLTQERSHHVDSSAALRSLDVVRRHLLDHHHTPLLQSASLTTSKGSRQ